MIWRHNQSLERSGLRPSVQFNTLAAEGDLMLSKLFKKYWDPEIAALPDKERKEIIARCQWKMIKRWQNLLIIGVSFLLVWAGDFFGGDIGRLIMIPVAMAVIIFPGLKAMRTLVKDELAKRNQHNGG